MRMRVIGLFVFLFISFTALPAAAQFSGSVGGEGVNITLDPQFPMPGETITATLDDYSLGSVGAEVAWYLDGTLIADSTNQRKISLTANTAGKPATLETRLRFANGQTLSAQKAFTPRYLDLIIEPQTFTPQFYRGRALPVHQSLVRAVAILHDQNGPVNSAEHTYTWRVNNTVVGGGAIRGGFQTVYTVPHGRSHTITLEVHNKNGGLVARRLTTVSTGEVEVALYEASPLYGLANLVAKSPLPMIGNSLTLVAAPYNLDLRVANGGNQLFSEWHINGQRTNTNSSNPFEITLNREGFGVAALTFKVRNLAALLQGDEASINLQF